MTTFLGHFGIVAEERTLVPLALAFVHRSHRMEAQLAEDNERLELLGDSVIGLATTEHLLSTHPESDEGELSKLRAALVSRNVLGKVARELGVGPLLLLSTGEERGGGRERSSILGSALEAVAGALYLVHPWESLCPALQRTIVVPAFAHLGATGAIDYKSQLQELIQRDGVHRPEYVLIDAEGPDHRRMFHVEVRVDGNTVGSGSGSRKQMAENEAARDAIRRLGDASHGC